jgi:hypothetical protein
VSTVSQDRFPGCALYARLGRLISSAGRMLFSNRDVKTHLAVELRPSITEIVPILVS